MYQSFLHHMSRWLSIEDAKKFQLIALCYGKMDTAADRCKRMILGSAFEPVWIRSPDFTYWVYSFGSPTQVTVQCQETGASPAYGPGRQVTLNGTGVLTDSYTCNTYSETFKLMPHTMGRTPVTLNKTHCLAWYKWHANRRWKRIVTGPQSRPGKLARYRRCGQQSLLTEFLVWVRCKKGDTEVVR